MPSSTASLLALAGVLLSTASYSQEVGSLSDVANQARFQNLVLESQMRWRDSKKIGVVKFPKDLPMPTQEDSMDLEQMQPDDVGSLAYWNFHVQSIVDEESVLLRLGSVGYIWLEAFPTKGLVDDESVRLIGPLRVTGSKAYTTVTGAKKTVRGVRFLSEKETNELQAAKEKEEKLAEAKLYEVYTSNLGTKVNAKFIGMVGSRVELLTDDKRTLKLPLSAFDKESAERLRVKIRESRAKERERK